jgi:hypothetical protein
MKFELKCLFSHAENFIKRTYCLRNAINFIFKNCSFLYLGHKNKKYWFLRLNLSLKKCNVTFLNVSFTYSHANNWLSVGLSKIKRKTKMDDTAFLFFFSDKMHYVHLWINIFFKRLMFKALRLRRAPDKLASTFGPIYIICILCSDVLLVWKKFYRSERCLSAI